MRTPPLNAVDFGTLPADESPLLSTIDFGALGYSDPSAPALSAIDFASIPALMSPTLGAVDFGALDAGPPAPPAIGSGASTLSFSASGQASSGFPGAGSATLDFFSSGHADSRFSGGGSATLEFSASGAGFQDWAANLPAIQLQEVYRLVITGAANSLPDLPIGGISSWQATNQAGSRSAYVQAVIPAADQYLADISARSDGELVIQKGYRLAGGEVRYEEILRSGFDTLRPDRGQRALTVTVSGYMRGNQVSSGSRALTGIRSISTQNGKRRVRSDIDMFLQPGMTVTALGETFKAGFINYYVSQADKFCEVGER